MSDPLTFDDATPRLGLPYLYAGQSQKEVFVNEALALLDTLVQAAIEGVLASPPSAPSEGMAWIVGASPSGDWAGHGDQIAAWTAGAWRFTAPRDGMRVLDRSTGQDRRYLGGWVAPQAPAEPSGGTTVDTQCRAALSALFNILRQVGIFAEV